MKWRLTGRYLASVVLIVIIIIVINILAILGLFIYQSVSEISSFKYEDTSAEEITRKFSDEIVVTKTAIFISEKGKDILSHNQSWIQILDENGRQVYGYLVPINAKTKYTPMDILQNYKYIEKELMSTVFVGEKQGNGQRYSYLIGFTSPYIARTILTYDIRKVAQDIRIGVLLMLGINGLLALCIAYLFSKRLTKPLLTLIDGIKQLAHKNTQIRYEAKGIYKDVFYSVNVLSEELQASEAERKKLDRMKEEWIANITHDIKTPLASIQGYAEMMKNEDYEFTITEMRDYAEVIEQKSLYLRDVIEDLNLSTRLKNKDIALNRSRVNIVSLVRNTVIDMLNDAKYGNRNIEFQYNDEVINIEVDEILIRRAVSNLIYNAVVHNDEDVAIQVGIERKDDSISIVVEDYGKGIVEEDLERIFDRHYRGTNTGELHKGSGLGMAIAHDIVYAHGGEIDVTSELGRGTRIEIRFDIEKAGAITR